MATFYVGQRVRIVYCKYPELFGDFAGRQGTVTGFGPCIEGPGNAVLIDGEPERRNDGRKFWFLSEQLEPIQPEGYKTVEWSECLWQPPHLRETTEHQPQHETAER
jgi:hypothetical protein